MFTIRSLLYFTAVIAALMLMLRETNGATAAGAFGFLMYLPLSCWYLYRHRNDEKAMMAEKTEREKRPD